ncbi:FKBP-type peptidyl-prolyl cis-trans isomerase [Nakamurella endophytica]|uniref:peptidylprolyl isomerase n=1 Tax=Nakamurella endophytica TaxID=1748367 RepID=A0A917T3Y3_9ACTN|nr:FKBP-type peptidyl-prolyl cis-trans isomerase [Nakamurella endophytica]GGM07471.1 hypothetical protein GCM10011594_29290 [Nakamurella endophytica]
MRIRAVLAALPLVLLAACGSGTSSTPTTDGGASGSSGASGSTASPAATLGPAVPAATVVAAAVPADQLPTATGGFGQKPTLTFPKGNPPPSLQRRILVQGNGATVGKGDYLVTNYLGQTWGGKVFDNSYDRKATSTFQIGTGQVVPGWDVGLVGLKVGDRVLLSLPPSDGYGSAGKAPDIKGTDTLVFVIDIVGVIKSDTAGQADAAPQKLPAGLPTISGAPGKEPTITIPKGLAEPKTNSVHVVDKGTGAPVKAGGVLVQLVVRDWAGTQTQSTWPPKKGAAATESSSQGLQQITVSADGALAGLVGVPLGSRVLVLIAGSTDQSTGQTQSAAAAVVDLVAQL